VVLGSVLLSSGCGATWQTVKPAPSPATSRAPAVFHTVQPGETLWAISRVYEQAVRTIADANDLDDVNRITAGQRLYIPGATELRAVPPVDLFNSSRPGPVLGWPLKGREILSRFGEQRHSHRHTGLDIRGNLGDPVYAAAAGTVIYSSTMRGYGRTVILDHGSGLQTLYAHNTALLVQTGNRVNRGQAIAKVGRSGNASTEHCHFEVRLDDVAVDPLNYL
jgi:murein DD-endopeptidase MepM/ murein hydrolase activator NlpD